MSGDTEAVIYTVLNSLGSFILFFLLFLSLAQINVNNKRYEPIPNSTNITNISETDNILNNIQFYDFSFLENEEKNAQNENKIYKNYLKEENSQSNRAKIMITISLCLSIVGIGLVFVLLFSLFIQNEDCCCEGYKKCYCCCCECPRCACCYCYCECDGCCIDLPNCNDSGTGDNPILGCIGCILFVCMVFILLFYAAKSCGKNVSRAITALIQVIDNIIILIFCFLCFNEGISQKLSIYNCVFSAILTLVNFIYLFSPNNRFCHCCGPENENKSISRPFESNVI